VKEENGSSLMMNKQYAAFINKRLIGGIKAMVLPLTLRDSDFIGFDGTFLKRASANCLISPRAFCQIYQMQSSGRKNQMYPLCDRGRCSYGRSWWNGDGACRVLL
jgi:hypothetical protein